MTGTTDSVIQVPTDREALIIATVICTIFRNLEALTIVTECCG
jgi:hypothetical protein